MQEFDLYKPMQEWFQRYLEGKYKGANVITIDSHAQTLDRFLEKHDLIDFYPQVVGLDIQIDVLGIVEKRGRPVISFIEAKKTQLTLNNLGQLWAYCELCNPEEAFLLSSKGLGSLNKILVTFNRIDLLDYGNGDRIKKMKVGKWDLTRNAVDFNSLIPR